MYRILIAAAFLHAISRTTEAAGVPENLEAVVARLAKVGSCSSPAFSPDGRQIAFVSNLSGLPQIWKVASSGGWPEMVTALEDPVGSVTWSPDGAWLAFNLAPGGGMNEQIYLVRPDGTGMRRLTPGARTTTGSASGAVTASS